MHYLIHTLSGLGFEPFSIGVINIPNPKCIKLAYGGHIVHKSTQLVGWCLTALSAQTAHRATVNQTRLSNLSPF